MTYILIVMWLTAGDGSAGKAALSVEFNDLPSCQAAAALIRKQEREGRATIDALLCAAKGPAK